MQSIIDISQINSLPSDTLMILKNNYENEEQYSLCLKAEELTSTKKHFKISFVVLDKIPMCVLMIKSNEKIYKCVIDFELENEYNYLKNLMNLKTFNLFVILNESRQQVIKISNLKSKEFIKALSRVKENIHSFSYAELINAKQKLLNSYTDKELWNMNY